MLLANTNQNLETPFDPQSVQLFMIFVFYIYIYNYVGVPIEKDGPLLSSTPTEV